jgi:hypothetical protein
VIFVYQNIAFPINGDSRQRQAGFLWKRGVIKKGGGYVNKKLEITSKN